MCMHFHGYALTDDPLLGSCFRGFKKEGGLGGNFLCFSSMYKVNAASLGQKACKGLEIMGRGNNAESWTPGQ